MNLYETSKEIATLHDEIIDAEGELSPELEAKLDALQLAFNDKVSNIGRWTINLIRKEDILKAEIERLEKRQKVFENLRSRLKNYLMLCMQSAEKTKVEFPQFTVSVQRNPPSAEVLDEAKVPGQYVKVIQITQLDKKKLLEDLKGGKEIPGARLATGKTHLRIR
jgi:hypothetical protein